MTTYKRPLCATCEHFHTENKESNTCDAFPDGIPWEIIKGKVDHREPYEGDNGIQYKESE